MEELKGTLEQVVERLNHLETRLDEGLREARRALDEGLREVRGDLRDKLDKWEVRIWFLILLGMTILFKFIK